MRRRFRHGRRLKWLIFVGCQIALVTALLWPALRSAPYTLPTTVSRTSITVPLLNCWTIWWNADRLTHGLKEYWNAPIFFPERGTFAFSDPQPATLAVAPWVWVTRSPVIAYHAYLWLSLLLNGVAAALLLRFLRVGWMLTIAGASAIVLLPIVWDNVDVVQLVPLWGILLSIRALLQFHEKTSATRAAAVALATASVFLTSVHHGLFFVISMLPACLWLLPLVRQLRWAVHVAGAALLFGVLTAPLLVPIAQVHAEHRFQRSRSTQVELSATLDQWARVPSRGLVSPQQEAVQARALNPGWIRCALALAAVIITFQRARNRHVVLFLLSFALTSCVLSFGMNLTLGSWKLWPVIGRVVPPLDSARSLFRFAYFAQLVIVIVATLGASATLRLLKQYITVTRNSNGSKLGNRLTRLLSLSASLLVVSALAIEVPPPRLRLISVPDTRSDQKWITYLKKNAQGQPILCLPFTEGFSEAGLESSARWMLIATQHRLALVNGYSGFFPATWYDNVQRFQADRWTVDMLRFLYDSGISVIVIDTRTPSGLSLAGRSLVIDDFQLTRALVDDRGIEVLRLSRRE